MSRSSNSIETKELVSSDLSYLNKKELILHNKLRGKLKEHLLPNEVVIFETSCGGASFFLTDRRIITINPLDMKIKEKKDINKIKVDSIYYKEIISVTYSDGILGYGSLVLHLKGNIEKPWTTFYEKPCKEIYKLITHKINPDVNQSFNTNIESESKPISKNELNFDENSIEIIGKEKNKWIAFALCLFLGYFGAHKFYEGKKGIGVLYLFTGGLLGIGWVVDTISLLLKPNPYYI